MGITCVCVRLREIKVFESIRHEKVYFLLDVAWFESDTHDWLTEPRKSHEHGMQGLSSSALTWPGEEGVCNWHRHVTCDMTKDDLYPGWSEESRDACLTVDTSCVITAAHTDSAPSPLTTDVQAEWQICHCLVKVTLLCFAMAVTLLKKRHRNTFDSGSIWMLSYSIVLEQEQMCVSKQKLLVKLRRGSTWLYYYIYII